MNRILLILLAISIAIFIIGVNFSEKPRMEIVILEPEAKTESIIVPPIKIVSKKEELPAPQDIKQTETLPVETSVKNNLEYPAVRPEYVAETAINIQSIVLVRCLFRTQYYASSTQPWGEENYNVGSGIVVSPGGNILTAKHILDVPEEALNDPAGRVWTRQKCDVALTDKDQSAIPAIGLWGQKEDSRFKEVEIIFEPSTNEYRESSGLDFAILKIKGAENLHFLFVVPELIQFEQKNPILVIGYPGRESASPQKLERFDAEFSELSFYPESLCGEAVVPCGLRYFIRRYPFDYAKDFWKPTEYGIVTPYFRGGFSGAPAFYRGNFIGIVTHGISGENSRSGWDEAAALASYDIALKLKEVNLAE
jgi:hypothetical protein